MHERNLEGQPTRTAVLLPFPLEGQAAALRTESLSASATPASIAVVDDRLTADHALRRIEAGELLWYIGDYPNGRQLLSALRRRLAPRSSKPPRAGSPDPTGGPLAIFRAERRQRAHEHRILSRLVVAVSRAGAVYGKRVPDVAGAVHAALGEREGWVLVPLQELLGMIGAAEWARKGVEVPGLEGRIHPVYGVFAPTRLEPAKLAAHIPDVAGKAVLDVGTGTGVLALLLLARGAASAVATDLDSRAVDCAAENGRRLGLGDRLQVLMADLFPAGGTFDVVVSNPPWLPEPPQTRLDGAIYDPDGRFVSGFLARLAQHLRPGGRGYLILSDFAERLGLREPDELRREAAASGLELREIAAERPAHPKAQDERDPLQVLRAAERTRLFELKV